MFLTGIVKDYSINKFSESEEFSIIAENMNLIQKLSESPSLELVLSESEQQRAVQAAEAYVKKVRRDVEKYTTAADRAKHMSEIWGWITFGLSVLTLVTGALVAAEVIIPVIAVIALLLTCVSSAIMVMKAEQARKYVLELGMVRRHLETHRERVQSHQVQDKIDGLLFKIQHIEDKVDASVGDARIINHGTNLPGN